MTSLFSPKKQKPDQAAERAQRQAAQDVNKQSAEEQRELGARKRLIAARASGNSSLFSTGSAQGVKETLG